MNPPDPISQSFIIKIWIEEFATDNQSAVWRGHITHVPSGIRKYVQDMSQIARAITPHLIELGVDDDDATITF